MKVKLFSKSGEKLMSEKQVFTCFLVLVTVFLFIFSCKKNDVITNEINVPKHLDKKFVDNTIKDSITIKILVPAHQYLLLNIRNKHLQNDALAFKNTTTKDSIITKIIFRNHSKQIIRFGLVVMDKGKIKNYFKHFYLIDEKVNNLNFKLKDNKDLELLNEDNSIIVDEIHKKYDSLKFYLNKNKDKDSLNKVYLFFKQKFGKENKNLFIDFNEMFYMSLLPNKSKIEINKYLENIKEPIVSDALYNLFYLYIRKNISEFDYSILNASKKSKVYLKYLSISMFNFLKNEDNKGDAKYKKAINWLKSTEFYKKDSLYIKKNITPLDNSLFKGMLNKISLTTIDKTDESLTSIIKKYPSKYYLIDFWATWCAPCIGGVKLMNKMDFPNNVKVLSISLDKEKDIEKWKQKTKELKQQYTYWLDEKSVEGKSFLQFIELQSIPRYILIDKDLNLIDQAFYHPHEPQFLNKLKDVKNHKYW